jgi:hypothetical protein
MAFDVLSHPQGNYVRLHPVEPRYVPLFCFGLLTVACALASFAFACATPFASFGVIAAATLPLGPALLVATAAWLVNQAIGFVALHYPVDGSTMLWGIVIGVAALVGTAAAALVLRLVQRTSAVIAFALALVASYAAYELALFAATPFLGGEGAFTLAIISRIGILNILWTIGLVVACEVARLLNQYRRRQTVS